MNVLNAGCGVTAEATSTIAGITLKSTKTPARTARWIVSYVSPDDDGPTTWCLSRPAGDSKPSWCDETAPYSTVSFRTRKEARAALDRYYASMQK
jgi:hypothetical protein